MISHARLTSEHSTTYMTSSWTDKLNGGILQEAHVWKLSHQFSHTHAFNSCAATLRRRAMAASSGDDTPAQLAALLGKEVVQIRKTD